MPQDPDGAFPCWPSLTRSDPALIDSITRPLYYITSPFTNLKQLRARLGLRPCQRGETLTRSSKRVKAEYEKKKKKNGERQAELLEVCLRRWRELEDRGEEGEKRENGKSIRRGSRRMKIEGWCGWDLVAEVEVAFERLRSSLRHRRRWPSLKTYRWRRCETVGQDSSSQRWPARLLRHSGDKPIPLLLLRPACFLSFLIWKRLIETSNCDTPSASFFSRKKDDNQFFTCLFFQQQKRSVFTQSPVSLAIVVASLLHQNRIKSNLFSEERVMIRVILFTRFFQFRFRRMLKKITLCKRNVEEGKKTLLHTNIRPLVQFDSPKLNFSSCHGCSSVAVYVSFAEWVGVYKKKGDGSSRFGIFFNHFLWCHGSVDDIVGLPTALVHTRPFQIEKAAHLQ